VILLVRVVYPRVMSDVILLPGAEVQEKEETELMLKAEGRKRGSKETVSTRAFLKVHAIVSD
jgi:hypothetical protein